MLSFNEIAKITTKLDRGAWVGNIPNLPGVRLLVRGYNNSDAARVVMAESAKFPKDELDQQDVRDAIEIKALHEAVLLGWEGIKEEFNPDNALVALSDPRFEVFRAGVRWASMNVGLMGDENLKADVKNSQPLSDGTSYGDHSESTLNT
jgi:hypothetical protein